jgi:hypothetical protein
VIKAVVALALAGGCVDDGGPRITSLSPSLAVPSQTVEIAGTRLCGPSGDCANVAATVELDAQPSAIDALVVSWTATLADVIVPSVPGGSYPVIVTVDGRSSNALTLVVME